MHIEVQVALNFVISYLYNKLPRRRVNIFGEELEKALKDKFQGHWYPEKPFKGSAFRCLKTGDPIDAVLERAARESGVPINDILENLPNELSVWVDPGEVSYRIGEKSTVKILYSENSDNHEENNSADREVTKTFNPEAQCFRPIDIVNSTMNNLSLSPKTSPLAGGSSPLSAASTSPTYKGSPNPIAAAAATSGNGTTGTAAGAGYMSRTQAPLTFTTATFAQTKFGSTKLKTNSKRANSNSSYRMSPTEFSNYIKQRAIQQQLHHGQASSNAATTAGINAAQAPPPPPNHFGPIGPVSPARSLSPNPLNMTLSPTADPFYFPSMSMGMYTQFNGHRNLFDSHYHGETNGLYAGAANNGMQSKFNQYLDPNRFFGINNGQLSPQQQQQQQQQKQQQQNANVKIANAADIAVNKETAGTLTAVVSSNSNINNNNGSNNSNGANIKLNNKTSANITVTISSASNETPINATKTAVSPVPTAAVAAATAVVAAAAVKNQQQQDAPTNSKLMDGLNSFSFSNAAGNSYQQLLVAN